MSWIQQKKKRETSEASPGSKKIVSSSVSVRNAIGTARTGWTISNLWLEWWKNSSNKKCEETRERSDRDDKNVEIFLIKLWNYVISFQLKISLLQ